MDEILIISFCLLLNGIFAAYEMAFVSFPRGELRKMAANGNARAKRLLKMRENPERTLSIIQIGITLVGAIAAAVGGAGASEVLEPYFVERGLNELGAEIVSIVIIVIPLTYLNVVVGELVPKSLALKNPVKVVMAGADTLFLSDKVFYPIITILERSTKLILRLFPRSSKNTVSEETAVEIDSLSVPHREIVLNSVALQKKKIRDTMVPWNEVNFVHLSDRLDDVAQMVFASGHTRLPVLSEGAVVGILHTKEFLALRESPEKDWTKIIRPHLVVNINDSSLKMLRTMQQARFHMAIVMSSGRPVGIITLEDVMEEIVGDIYDEDDDGRIRKLFLSRSRLRK